MGNKNHRTGFHFGCAQIPCLPLYSPDKSTTTNPSTTKQSANVIHTGLLLTDRNLKHIRGRRGGRIESIARRTGCEINVLPKKEGDKTSLVKFSGSVKAVNTAKAWVKDILAKPFKHADMDINGFRKLG